MNNLIPDFPQEEKEELYEHFRFQVDKGSAIVRIDKYLLQHLPDISRNKIQQAAKAGCILVNSKPEKQNYRTKPLDIISILLPNEPKVFEMLPENIPLSILYEDDDIVIINKNAGMVVHPAYGNYTGTLVNALMYHFEKQKNNPQPYLVHRIDKNTSGVLVAAKNEEAQIKLAKLFFEHTIDRKYLSLVWGDFKEEEGTITENIGRDPKNRLRWTVYPKESEVGKHAVTHYKVIERFGYVTLIECVLETGRTHQIRVHMRSIGHPLFNDSTYGGDEILKGTTFTKYKQFIQNCFKLMPRHALHAKSLGFIHPTTNKYTFFDSEMPEDFEAVLAKWRVYSTYKTFEDEVLD